MGVGQRQGRWFLMRRQRTRMKENEPSVSCRPHMLSKPWLARLWLDCSTDKCWIGELSGDQSGLSVLPMLSHEKRVRTHLPASVGGRYPLEALRDASRV